MNPPATVLVGLAFLAGSNALPIGSGFAGISLAPGSLNSFYNQEVVIGNFPVNYGFSWTKDGTLEAGFRVETKINGRIVPLAIAVSGNTRDLRRTFKFEAGGRFLDSLSAVIYGDRDGLKWMYNTWIPLQNPGGSLNAIGLSIEGDRTKPVAFTGGVGIRNKVYQARIKLDEFMRPFGTQLMIGTSGSKFDNNLMFNQHH